MWPRVRCIVGLTLLAIGTFTLAEYDKPGCNCVCKPVLNTEATLHPANSTSQWLIDAALSQISIHENVLKTQQTEIDKLKDRLTKQGKSIDKLKEEKNALWKSNKKLKKKIEDYVTNGKCDKKDVKKHKKYTKEAQILPKDCADLQIKGIKYEHGRKIIQRIYPVNDSTGFKVLCDFDTDNGGWTIIQRRIDGIENFSRKWSTYKKGFGKLQSDFWLGNDKIHILTNIRMYELRIEMGDFKGKTTYANYKSFNVANENNRYQLTIGDWSGKSAGDSMKHHNGKYFSTYDHDNDQSKSGNCAQENSGGWWYGRCYDANLNGKYGNKHMKNGMVWYHWKNNNAPLQWTEMKIRPIGFKTQQK